MFANRSEKNYSVKLADLHLTFTDAECRCGVERADSNRDFNRVIGGESVVTVCIIKKISTEIQKNHTTVYYCIHAIVS